MSEDHGIPALDALAAELDAWHEEKEQFDAVMRNVRAGCEEDSDELVRCSDALRARIAAAADFLDEDLDVPASTAAGDSASVDLDQVVDAIAAELDQHFDACDASVDMLLEELARVDALHDQVEALAILLEDDTAAALDMMQDGIDARAHGLGEVVNEKLIPALRDDVGGVGVSLAGVVGRVSSSLGATGRMHEDASRAVIDGAANEASTRLTATSHAAATLEHGVDAAGALYEDTGRTLSTTKETLKDAVHTCTVGLQTALGILDELRRLISRAA